MLLWAGNFIGPERFTVLAAVSAKTPAIGPCEVRYMTIALNGVLGLRGKAKEARLRRGNCRGRRYSRCCRLKAWNSSKDTVGGTTTQIIGAFNLLLVNGCLYLEYRKSTRLGHGMTGTLFQVTSVVGLH